MRYAVGGAFAFSFALVQASSVEQFHVLGVAPNLVLVMLMAWLVIRGLEDVLPLVAAAGVTLGFIGLQTPGLVLLAMLLPVAALGAVREMHIVHSEALLVLLFVAAGTIAYETVLLAGIMATGGALDPLTAYREAVVPAAIVNLAITPPVFLLMRLARPARVRRGFAY